MERGDRLILKEELRVKLETYDAIIRRLQNEKYQLWQQQMLNEHELQKSEGDK